MGGGKGVVRMKAVQGRMGRVRKDERPEEGAWGEGEVGKERVDLKIL